MPTKTDMDDFDFTDRVEKGYPDYKAALEERDRRDAELRQRMAREQRRRGTRP